MYSITKNDTNYALGKQLHNDFSIEGNYGQIALTEFEHAKLKEFLIKLLEERENTFKNNVEYNK